ncbi:hypothetical protein [Rhodococcus sp. SGAir0479]|uniref:hypothetical protein n=1 Tax=Rhodococcus sp. SGAir0479 TaxID=2567884 RepID=UPI0010CD24C9|nr:hypothetical protein [Rhodococcus sp. SGAir0479]QCQ91396.1 hypothetical protein E7742_09190 [Rhodococcus sp. SGAir0479]
MAFGVLATVLAGAFHLVGAVLCARVNTGRVMPMVRGVRPARPARRVRRFDTAGWTASVVGALAIGDALWDSRPGASIAVTVAILVLVNGLPGLIVATLHNRRQPS